MGVIKTKGIVIQEASSGDYDKVLTILTPDFRENYMFCKKRKKT